MSARILLDYVGARLRALVRGRREETFEDWALNRFGRTLYRIFFQPYTEKVWGIPARQLSAHWSRERIDLLHLFHALLRAVFPSRGSQPRTYASTFRYPTRGIGRLAERLAEEIRALGGEILCDCRILGMQRSDGRIVGVWGTDSRGQGLRWAPHQVVSTVPLPEWVSLLSPSPPGSVIEAASRLKYRHMVFVYLLLSRDRVSSDTWIYVPSDQVRICRIHEPKNWSLALVPEGRTSLCVEIFSSREGDLWTMDDRSIVTLAIAELGTLGLIEPDWVLDHRVLRVPYTHPVYEVGFDRQLEVIREFVTTEMSNFHLLGRTGGFQYKNMDQVMVDGFRLGGSLHRALGDPE
jgi:protoporphyrinogen oxidase